MIDFIKLNAFGIKRIFYFDTIDSTNDYARKEKPEDDTLIIAGYQYEGKGRLSRKWDSEKNKGLTFTLVRSFDISDIHAVNFYTSYIILLTLREILESGGFIDLSNNLSLKWPNDILLCNKKVSGILSEVSDLKEKIKKFYIGAGINVNQEEFEAPISEKAISLKIATGKDFDTSEIVSLFVKNFYENLAIISNTKAVMKLWRSNTFIIGKTIRFTLNEDSSEFKGKVLSIQDDGGIKLELLNSEKEKNILVFYSGEISFIY